MTDEFSAAINTVFNYIKNMYLLLALLKTVVLLHIFTESSTKSHKQANVINNYKEMTSETELNKTEIASSCKM